MDCVNQGLATKRVIFIERPTFSVSTKLLTLLPLPVRIPVKAKFVEIMSNDQKTDYPPVKYSIKELLDFKKSLPFVTCPIQNFSPDAWTEGILIQSRAPLFQPVRGVLLFGIQEIH